jgi:hypothetical protein
MKTAPLAVAGLVVLAVAGAAAWWWMQPNAVPAPAPAPEPLPVAMEPPPVPPVASAPSIAHPIEAASAALAASAPAAEPLTLASALTQLFGRKAVLQMFQEQDFAQRVVATVDNLGRAQATSRLWPVNPAPGRFLMRPQDGATVIDADNGLRYTPHVLLLESVDLSQLTAAYVKLYPEFQRAYEELGYPKGYFNDRLVEVIDLLLATPEVRGPLAVHMPTINSPVKPARPWVLYEFDDPALEALSAGQKMLLRMGPVNERRVKARLRAWRQLIAAVPVAR